MAHPTPPRSPAPAASHPTPGPSPKARSPQASALTSTGVIAGTPTAGGTSSFTVTLTDSGAPGLTATAAYTITSLYPTLSISPTALPNGTFGTAYMASLTATGGSGTGYTFAVSGGTGLSAVGLTLSPSGAITGTPTAGETAGTFSVTVTDSAANTATANLALTIVYPTLTITTSNLSSGVAGDAYTATLAATGGSGTGYTWSVTTGASSLTAVGLSLSSGGVLSGATPATGTAAFTVKVTDSGNNTATANLSVTINASLAVTTTTLPNGVEGTVYSTTLAATGGSGTGYTWSVTSGTALSAVGLTLSPTGAITGTPTTGETAIPLTVTVTDSNGNTATANLTLTVTAVAFQGQVLSGTVPVNGATIQLYAAGATGNGSAAIPMLTQAVTTDPIGMFQLKGLYTCGQSSTGASVPATAQLYLVATGGIASSTSTSSNAALTMVTAVGPCTNLTTIPFHTINEVTTAATAWALSAFATSATNIGATSTNTLGITNAFLDAALLANPSTGADATLPTNLTVETGKLNALSRRPQHLHHLRRQHLHATLHRGHAHQRHRPQPTPSPPRSTSSTTPARTCRQSTQPSPPPRPHPTPPPRSPQSPNDWTMSLTVTGGGIFMPTALGIDTQNNIWVANQDGPLSAFNPQGTPLSSTGYGLVAGVSQINEVYGLAIDPSNNIWVTNT